MDSATEVSAKRYRFTGKERDEESGLYYHGARYYAPWLARWTAPDPAGMVDGPNLYQYVRGNPVRLVDPDGRESGEGGQENTTMSYRELAQSADLRPWLLPLPEQVSVPESLVTQLVELAEDSTYSLPLQDPETGEITQFEIPLERYGLITDDDSGLNLSAIPKSSLIEYHARKLGVLGSGRRGSGRIDSLDDATTEDFYLGWGSDLMNNATRRAPNAIKGLEIHERATGRSVPTNQLYGSVHTHPDLSGLSAIVRPIIANIPSPGDIVLKSRTHPNRVGVRVAAADSPHFVVTPENIFLLLRTSDAESNEDQEMSSDDQVDAFTNRVGELIEEGKATEAAYAQTAEEYGVVIYRADMTERDGSYIFSRVNH